MEAHKTVDSLNKNMSTQRVQLLKKKWNIIVFLLVCIFLSISMLDSSVAEPQKDSDSKADKKREYIVDASSNVEVINEKNFEIQIISGINSTTKLYRNILVNINIKSISNEFEGTVNIIIPQSKEGTLYSREIQMKAGEYNNINMNVPVNIMTDKLIFTLEDKDGKSVIRKDIKIITYDNSECMVGILAEEPAKLNYIGEKQGSVYYYFTDKTMPVNYKQMNALDLMVINRYDLASLSSEQYAALVTWVKNGGTLVLGTGTGAASVLRPLNNNIMNSTVSGTSKLEISFTDKTKQEIEVIVKEEILSDNYTIDNTIWADYWNLYRSGKEVSGLEDVKTGRLAEAKPANASVIDAYVKKINKRWMTTDVANITIQDAITIESSSALPIIQSVNRGKGKIIVAAFDLMALENNEDMKEQLSTIIYSYSSIGSDVIYNKFIESILESTKGKMPNPIIYVIIIILYIVLMIVTIIILNNRNKSQKLFYIIPFYALIGCLVFFLLGFSSRTNKLHAANFSITKIENSQAIVEKYFNVTVPTNEKCDLEVDEKNEIVNLVSKSWDSSSITASGESYNTEINTKKDNARIKFDGLSPFDTKMFGTVGIYKAENPFNVSINCWDNKYTGQVENLTSTDIDYVFILTKSVIIYVGEMRKNSKSSVESAKYMKYTSVDELEDIIPQLLDKKRGTLSSIDSKGKITANGITRVMQYYLLSNKLSGEDDASVFGITNGKRKIFKSEKIAEESIEAVASNCDINYSSGKEIFVPNICASNITFEFGNYNYSNVTGSVNIVEDTVAEYNIGKNQTVKSLELEINQNKGKTNSREYSGKVLLWNFATNAYDEIFKDKESKVVTNLSNYIGSNRTIKFKFDVDDSVECNLPIMSAVIVQK